MKIASYDVYVNEDKEKLFLEFCTTHEIETNYRDTEEM